MSGQLPSSFGLASRGALLSLLGLSAPAAAATWTVAQDGSGQYSTISAAISAASSGDTLSVGPGTYTEVVDFGGKDLVVQSTDGADTTLIDATGKGSWAVQLVAGESAAAVLQGFTVRNDGAGGLYALDAAPTLRELVFEDLGSSTAWGGAVLLWRADASFTDVRFSDNTALYGGHLYATDSSVSFDAVEMRGGAADSGGAVYLTTQSSLRLVDSSLRENAATAAGGALYVTGNSALDLQDSDVDENTVETGYGGGIYLGSYCSASASDGSISDNAATDYTTYYNYAGGVYVGTYGSLVLEGTAVDDNTAFYGGGLFADSGSTLELRDVQFTDNYAYYGGGFWSYATSLTIWDSAFEGNAAIYYGGAGLSYYATSVDMRGIAFTENLAYYSYGGALFFAYMGDVFWEELDFVENLSYYDAGAVYFSAASGAVEMRELLFDANEAQYGSGGGMSLYYSASVAMSDARFVDNAAYYGAGGLYLAGVGFTGEDLSFEDNSARYRSGGGLYADGARSFGLRLTDSSFEGNTAGGDGGGLTALDVVDLELSDLWFQDNAAEGAGGGVNIGEPATLAMLRVELVGNEALYGGGLYLSEGLGAASELVLQNVLLLDNTAEIGGGAALVDSLGATFRNSAFAGNRASDVGSALALVASPVVLQNTAVVAHSGPAAVYAWDSTSTVDPSYSGWYDNAGGDVDGALVDSLLDASTVVRADPLFSGDPGAASADAADLVLLRDSPYLDAGDPSLSDTDASQSDIGLWGGPRVVSGDADGDGISAWQDCDDTDATVYPGAAETWYDGKNADCLSGSDHDQDGDGVDAVSSGGEDCDDTDPSATGPCADDTGGADTGATVDTGGDGGSGDGGGDASDGGASDGPGAAPSDPGCGCAASPAQPSPPVYLGLLVLLPLARRRRPG